MSSQYICNKCNKDFKIKGNYTFHINRKTPCIKADPINLTCEKCNHVFSTATNLSKHCRSSKCGKASLSIEEKVENLEKKNCKLEKIVEELKKERNKKKYA